ncbi:MAG: 30S ribosomal protein S4 [Candidatus Andersenbacteria bacterium]
MARKLDSKCERCRRQGEKLFLKGERCFSPKCAMNRRAFAPGQHGQTSRSRVSEFGLQHNEKQKARHSYDVLERQFRTYFEKAAQKKGVTGEQLLSSLERRLDNVVYRMQLAKSRRSARQLVRHGHITVNGSRVNVPSYQVDEGDVVTVGAASAKLAYFAKAKESVQPKLIPQWLEVDVEALKAQVASLPTASDVDQELRLGQIVEYYSR